MKALEIASLFVALTTASASPSESDVQAIRPRASLPPITTRGNAFWTGDKRFYIRGIGYQPGGSSAGIDPLADTKICLRDIPLFEKLGVNAIRIYSVDNSKNHDECMEALEKAGIYLILDVNTPKYSINRIKAYPSYNAKYLQSVFATVEMFAKYDNTMAFFSGNEVMDNTENSDKAAPYVKAVTRDIRKFIKSRRLRAIPVGFSATDVSKFRMQTAMYMNCGPDDVRSDFFAFNDYAWCNSNMKISGWDQKVQNFTDYGLPIFLSEWGCNKNRPRKFEELSALMSPDMTSVYSGGLMYEYTTEEHKFGIVELSSDGKSVQTSTEFELFQKAMEEYTAPTGDGGAATTTHGVSCPTSDSSWQVEPSRVPRMPKEAEKYMTEGAGPGPGLKGGSQTSVESGTSEDRDGGDKTRGGGGAKGEDEDSGCSARHGGLAALAVAAASLVSLLVS